MLDKKLKVNYYEINTGKLKQELKIKVISDLHLSNSFDDRKLDTIYDNITSTKTDYLFICGDIIDSTNFLYTNINLKNKYIKWFEKLSEHVTIYMLMGNHDRLYIKNNKYKEDKINDFFKKIGDIPNIYISNKGPLFKLENLNILMIEPNLKYYYEEKKNINILIKELKRNINYLDNVDDKKLNILLIHSPIDLEDKEVLKYTKKYDIILSGHMHKGAIPFNIGRILPGNVGLVSPKKKLFPKLARGLKKIKNEDKYQYLIISGGITKIQECTKKLSVFNHLFSMEIEYVKIK